VALTGAQYLAVEGGTTIPLRETAKRKKNRKTVRRLTGRGPLPESKGFEGNPQNLEIYCSCGAF